MARSVKNLPAHKHPHNCQCKTCTHCANLDDVDLPTEPPFCDPCWGHGGAKAMTYKDYVEGHVTPPTSSSGSSSESNLASRFPTHNDFFGPTIDDVFVKIYNFGRNHPPPLHDCIKANCKCEVCHQTCGKEPGCDDGTCPIKGGEGGGPYGGGGGGGGGNDGMFGGGARSKGPWDSNHSNISFASGGGGGGGGEHGDHCNKKKKPKYCHGKICGKGKSKDGDDGEGDEDAEKKTLGEDECDETTCGVGDDGKDEADWGIRDAFGVGIDETLLALLSQFSGWFKKRKKKKKEPVYEEPPCTCTEPIPYEPHDGGPGVPIKFEKGPLDVVHWLHEEFLSLCQDMEDAAAMDTPDTDGPLSPESLKKRSDNLDAISELLTEKRGLEQAGDPEQVDHKRSRAPSHYAEADISSMGVKPKVVETTGPGGQRKSVINWEDAHDEQMLTRQSVSRQSMMGPRKSVVLRPRGTHGEHHSTWSPPLHEFGHEEPVYEQHSASPFSSAPSPYDSPGPYGAGSPGPYGGGGHDDYLQHEDHERPRSILHKGNDTKPARHIKMFDDEDDHGPRGRKSSAGPRIHFDQDHDNNNNINWGERRSTLKYKTTPDDVSNTSGSGGGGGGARIEKRVSHSSGEDRDDDSGATKRCSRSRSRTTPPSSREIPGDDDAELRDMMKIKMRKHQSPQRPTSIVEVTRRTTESYKPNRKRGLFAKFGKSKPTPVDVEVESTQTIWHSSTFDEDSCSDENRAEKPYVEMALKGERKGSWGSACAVRSSRSFREEDVRRALIRKNRKHSKRRHEWDKDWEIDAAALQRTVNTQFPSTQTVRVTASCKEEKTYHTPEGCKRTDRTKTINTPRVVTLRDGEPVVTGSNTVQVTIKKPRGEGNACDPPRHRYIVKHDDDGGDDDGGGGGGRCSSRGSRKSGGRENRSSLHDFDIDYQEPPRKRPIVIIRREVSDDDDDDDDDEEEGSCRGRKRRQKKRKKRGDDDDEDDEDEDDEKRSKSRRRRRKSKDNEEDEDEDDSKSNKNAKNGKKRRSSLGDDEDEDKKGKRRKSKKMEEDDEDEEDERNGKGKAGKRKGSKKGSKKGKNGKSNKDEDEEDDEDEGNGDGKKKKKNGKKRNGKNGDSDEEDEDEDEGRKKKRKGRGRDRRGRRGRRHDEDECEEECDEEECDCHDDDSEKVYRVVRAVKKNNKTKILPVITKVEVLDGTKRRAVLEWDDECANVAPTKQPQGPKKCIREVMWAVTKITVFQDGTRAYEVKKPTRKTPTGRIPTVTEMLFMVQARGCPPGGVAMYDKAKIAAMEQCNAAGGERKPCCTEGMTKAFQKTDVDRYRIYKKR